MTAGKKQQEIMEKQEKEHKRIIKIVKNTGEIVPTKLETNLLK